jgi:hypothetical protein
VLTKVFTCGGVVCAILLTKVARDPHLIRNILPTTFPIQPHPYDYFTLFFTPDLFRTITTNTNRYTTTQRLHAVEENQREWTDLLVEELYVFIGAIIYIEVHEEPEIPMY